MTPSRVIIVVPRREAKLHAYLQESLACLADVEVVLDRRAAASRPHDERRRPAPGSSERQLPFCSLVRYPVSPAPPPKPVIEAPADSNRTLLWPALRLEQL